MLLNFSTVALDFLWHLKMVFRGKTQLNEKTAWIHFGFELKYCIGSDKQILPKQDPVAAWCAETMNFYDISENCLYFSKVCQLCTVVL